MRQTTKERTRASGTMTEAQFIAFIKSALRSKSRFWKPLSDTLKSAHVSRGHYLCNMCKQVVTKSIHVDGKRVNNVYVDHINPVIDTETGFTAWDDFIENLFCEADNLQLLCYNCHNKLKTPLEKSKRKEFALLREEFPENYQTWSNMNDRCSNPKATGYKYYGAKGIEVCPSWTRDGTPTPFKNFLNDMGIRPKNTTLDRINYTQNYSVENCRWATCKEQARNTSANNWIEYQGEFKILQEWGESLGIKPNSILTRLRRGWTVGQALGLEGRGKEDYVGRLTPDDFEFIREGLLLGKTLTDLGEDLEMDTSQLSRIVSKFNLGKSLGAKSYEYKGQYKTLPDWAKEFDIDYFALNYQLKKGKTLSDLLENHLEHFKEERLLAKANKDKNIERTPV